MRSYPRFNATLLSIIPLLTMAANSFAQNTETELKIKELTKATIRCIPDDVVDEEAEVARMKKTDEDRLTIREGIVGNAQDDPRTTSNLVRKWLRESE